MCEKLLAGGDHEAGSLAKGVGKGKGRERAKGKEGRCRGDREEIPPMQHPLSTSCGAVLRDRLPDKPRERRVCDSGKNKEQPVQRREAMQLSGAPRRKKSGEVGGY